MAEQRRLYPIGQQDFPSLRENGSIYIDKTGYVYRMTHSDSQYMFLSRPRRFGKSLLLSTLQAYFEGRKELFEGLAIEKLERDWERYPVISLDMSLAKHETPELLSEYLDYIVVKNEKRLGIEGITGSPNLRLSNLIQTTCETTGKKVVVLIDEYDSPLLDVVHEEENLPKLRKAMRNFYSPLKACAPYLKYVFLTGITKFSQLSIFSELNNIENISMDEKYAAICGISKEELLTQMSPDIDLLAKRLGTTREQTIAALVDNYDGYHFTWPSPDIFNPFSLLMAMNKGRIDAYWFGSGTPTYIIEMMRKFGTPPSKLGKMELPAARFDAPTETMTSIVPLLYQAGYLTIKDCDSGLYTLDLPNSEIKVGLMESLLPYYVDRVDEGATMAVRMRNAINKGDMDGALRLLQDFFETIPYTANASSEGHYQQVLVIIFRMLGFPSDVELHTKAGRIDIELKAGNTIYVMEIKTHADAVAAMRQIDAKAYAAKYSLSSAAVVKVAISFDPAARNIKDWAIETV